MKQEINYKDYSILKLHLTLSRREVSLKTASGNTLATSWSNNYKIASCFQNLFKELGCDVSKIDYTKLDLFDLGLFENLNEANQFLKENNINYKVNYRTKINQDILFIELQKINNN
jgi:hypothetical protein